jgi:hypothetical protein
MRKQGITDFPDPDSQGHFALGTSAGQINQYSPAVLAAGKSCISLADGAIKPPGAPSS